MAQRLFERRLLYHRVKVSLITVFPKPADWDESPSSIEVYSDNVALIHLNYKLICQLFTDQRAICGTG